mmetsp:Transcript_20410/g.26318  ORF Transcript_20410/g.26318 Transcript_20410/m.26318 type:complete len:369 (-) Transcript_20410:72-1178(-)|eukprot:CAMPEP_0198138260 /NCGR_PEP_ID=MMETSP1443-20131203/1679_1 /TAXON_ID=186043 /ORGANISM="Entomoneis sp., Strain CCMP2396" /LENGTH=368 /DNA_ID=CAMNT_0043799963 /DNA_START=20 /DNA_END=1126 /DNA_ORIENTATION=+
MSEEESKSDADDMTPDERLGWLREHGIEVVIPEERRAGQVAGALKEASSSTTETTEISYVLVPADTSKPLQELVAHCPTNWREGDFLAQHLTPAFAASSSTTNDVDLSLLSQRTTATLAGTAVPSVSDASLRKVAQEANVELFSLVHPTESNQYTGVYIYLDESGMLKRLPLNTRAIDFAKRAGYDPAPQFYGNIYLGRVKRISGGARSATGKQPQHHESFVLGYDTDARAPWLKQAATDNLDYQMQMNRMTGQNNVQQPNVDGAEGKAKQEESFSWTQTEEEVEVTVVLPTGITTSKQIQVKFRPQSLHITAKGGNNDALVALQLFERVDVDGCTWTMEKSKTPEEPVKLVITMEKMEAALWPRIKD